MIVKNDRMIGRTKSRLSELKSVRPCTTKHGMMRFRQRVATDADRKNVREFLMLGRFMTPKEQKDYGLNKISHKFTIRKLRKYLSLGIHSYLGAVIVNLPNIDVVSPVLIQEHEDWINIKAYTFLLFRWE